MKAVHLVLSDQNGAGRAAVRICEAERECGIDAQLYSFYRTDKNTQSIDLSTIEKLQRVVYKRVAQALAKSCKPQLYFHIDGKAVNLMDREFIKNADVIHFHWLNEGLFSFNMLKRLAEMNKPVVWTLHDNWPFTGGCHRPIDCNKYMNGCIDCRKLVNKGYVAEQMLKRKIEMYKKMNLVFIGCSKWMADNANASFACKYAKIPCINIPNPINTAKYHPIDCKCARNRLGITDNKKLILVGAANLNDSTKGMALFLNSIKHLDRNEYTIISFGNERGFHSEGFNEIKLGFLNDKQLALAYNACDVFVAPSTYDNLPNTVMEALACGTPVVAFDVGGMPDMIIKGSNGYLADPFSVEDLAKGIRYCSDGHMNRSIIAKDASNRFSYATVGFEYKRVYKEMLGEIV